MRVSIIGFDWFIVYTVKRMFWFVFMKNKVKSTNHCKFESFKRDLWNCPVVGCRTVKKTFYFLASHSSQDFSHIPSNISFSSVCVCYIQMCVLNTFWFVFNHSLNSFVLEYSCILNKRERFQFNKTAIKIPYSTISRPCFYPLCEHKCKLNQSSNELKKYWTNGN